MDSNQIKRIIFVYKKDEFRLNVRQTIPMEYLTGRIKSYFKIPPDVILNFVDLNTEICLISELVSDFWETSTEPIPVFRVEAGISKKI